MTKKNKADIAISIFVTELSKNFDRAFELSGKAINQTVPCFIGSEKHLETIIRLAEKLACEYVKIDREESSHE